MNGPSTLLDNPVWHAVTGPLAALAVRTERAGRLLPEVGPFAGLHDPADPAAWEDLGRLLDGHGGALIGAALEVPAGWTEVARFPVVQMVAQSVAGRPSESAEPLGPPHVDEILELIAATNPGPFGRRTVELGGYIGIRDGGRLVAMAGERLRLAGHTEISAVCTAPSHQGRGLATELVLAVVDRIQARGERPFLHADARNENAIRLYRALGFVLSADTEVTVVRLAG